MKVKLASTLWDSLIGGCGYEGTVYYNTEFGLLQIIQTRAYEYQLICISTGNRMSDKAFDSPSDVNVFINEEYPNSIKLPKNIEFDIDC